MKNKSFILTLLVVVTLASSLTWYLCEDTEIKEVSSKVTLSSEEAEKILGDYQPGTTYYKKEFKRVEVTKTIIPFVYNRRTLKHLKTSYHSY